MPWHAVNNDKCPKCDTAVYVAEERLAAGKKWHKMCLKCALCEKLLDSTTVAEHDNEIYCKTCHSRKFGPKSSNLVSSSDSGRHHGTASSEMSGAIGAGIMGPEVQAEKGGCWRCNKKVYDAERAIGCPDGMHLHKACWRCKVCKSNLDSSTVCISKEDKEVYCKCCYGKKHGPRGVGFGQGAGALSMG